MVDKKLGQGGEEVNPLAKQPLETQWEAVLRKALIWTVIASGAMIIALQVQVAQLSVKVDGLPPRELTSGIHRLERKQDQILERLRLLEIEVKKKP